MPHVIVKMYKGRSDQQKKALADKIAEAVIAVTECKETSVSIAIEEFEPADWAEKLYRPDILEKDGNLIKKPGYDPFFKTEPTKERQKEGVMAYDEGLAERLNNYFEDGNDVDVKKMFGGLCFMISNHMCCGIIGETLKAMKGLICIDPEGIAEDPDLEKWLGGCEQFVRSLPSKKPKMTKK